MSSVATAPVRRRPDTVPDIGTAYESCTISTLTPHLGAEVVGLDLSQALDETQLRDLRRAFHDWGVLEFRDHHLDREAHKAFGRHFGDLHTHPMHHDREGDPEILVVKTTAESPYGERVSIINDQRPQGVNAGWGQEEAR